MNTHTPPPGMIDEGLKLGQAREFTLILGLKPGGADRMRERYKAAPAGDVHLMDKVATVHDLRFVPFDNDTRVIFATVYDGGFEQYIIDFATLVPEHIDREFQDCVGYPGVKSADIWKYIADHQVPAIAFYSAYPDASVRDVWKALKTKASLEALLDSAT